MKLAPTSIAAILVSTTALAETSWERYLNYPSSVNAAAVTEIKYSPSRLPEDYSYWATDLDILQNQIIGGDSESFRLAMRLLERSGGALFEDIAGILASAIRPQPKMFLTEITRANDHNLKFIIQYAGLEYADRLEAQNFEMRMRRVAMLSVEDENLLSIKQKCLKYLVSRNGL